MLFKLFGTPILKYTNIDYQRVTNLSPKSDEDKSSSPSLTLPAGRVREGHLIFFIPRSGALTPKNVAGFIPQRTQGADAYPVSTLPSFIF